MLLLTPFFSVALSSEPTAEQQTAAQVATAITHRQGFSHTITGCGAHVGGPAWQPTCSNGTLTEVSNMLYYARSDALAAEAGDHAAGANYRVIEAERKRLSDPAVVRQIYAELQPLAVPMLKYCSTDWCGELRNYVRNMLVPDFTREVSPRLRALYATEAAAEKAMTASQTYDDAAFRMRRDPKLVTAYEAANIAFGTAAIAAGFHDPLAVQWRLRREKEGGKELVEAYRHVFTVFAEGI